MALVPQAPNPLRNSSYNDLRRHRILSPGLSEARLRAQYLYAEWRVFFTCEPRSEIRLGYGN